MRPRSVPSILAVALLAASAATAQGPRGSQSVPKAALDFKAKGTAYFLQSQNAPAIAAFTEALKFAPDDAEALARRGDCHLALGQTDAALDDYNAAIDADPKAADARDGRAYTLLSIAPTEPRSQESALADFEAALKSDPKNAEAHLGRFYIYRIRRHGKSKSEALRLAKLADRELKAALKADRSLAPYVTEGFFGLRSRHAAGERQRMADLAAERANERYTRREQERKVAESEHQKQMEQARLMINAQAAQRYADAVQWQAYAQQQQAAATMMQAETDRLRLQAQLSGLLPVPPYGPAFPGGPFLPYGPGFSPPMGLPAPQVGATPPGQGPPMHEADPPQPAGSRREDPKHRRDREMPTQP